MKLQKRLLSLLLCAALVFGLCLPAAAEEVVDFGYFEPIGGGSPWKWVLYSDGVLTLDPDVNPSPWQMPDFDPKGAPWYEKADQIKSVEFVNIDIGSCISVGNNAFYNCTNLTSITLPDGLTSIGNNAFFGCTSLKEITLPNGLTSIGGYAFSNCTNLTTITLPDGLTTIGTEAFYLCESLETMQLPDSVTSIGEKTFNGCTNLSEITLPENLKSVGDLAFYKCTSLETIRFPEGLNSIGTQAFMSCTGLTSVTFTRTTPPEFGNKVFTGCDNLTEIRVPPEAWPAYNTALQKAGLDTNNVTVKGAYPVTVTAGEGGTASASPDFAAEGDTVTLTATPNSGWQFKEWQVTAGNVSVSGNSFTMPAASVAVTAVFEKKQSGGSSGGGGYIPPTPPTYPPAVEQPDEGGSVSVTPSRPQQGDTVTVTPKPDEGYEVGKIIVTDQNGNPVEVTVKPDGSYTFQQPSGKVTIEIIYNWLNPFTDLDETAWYYEAVKFVQQNGLMNGYGGGRFAPHYDLSRSQLAQILFNKEGRPSTETGGDFSDIDSGDWYAEAVTWAAENGIVSGYGNGAFGPNDPITREQLAVMLWRYVGSPAANKELDFNDEGEISSFALEALRWAVENSVLNGYEDGRLGPQGQATRAEAAQMLKNFVESQEGNT